MPQFERTFVFISATIAILLAFVQTSIQQRNLLNKCADNGRRQQSPTKISTPFSFCVQWQSNSCCTSKTEKSINFYGRQRLDGENLRVCGNLTLSYRCEIMFKYESCFYECDPNLGPWMLDSKLKRQEFQGIPICASSCDLWYQMCEFDLTCGKNWYEDMIWTPSGNRCRPGAKCKTYNEMYGSAKAFCESIRGSTYKYVANNENCLLLKYFSLDNPNSKVVQRMFGKRNLQNSTGPVVTKSTGRNRACASCQASPFLVVKIFMPLLLSLNCIFPN